jgi:hypothetical protein
MNKYALILILLLSSACAGRQAKSAPAAPLSPETMMDKLKEAATPGEHHKQLQALVGEWKTSSTFWYDPDKDPELSQGSSSHKWILGGRYVEQTYSGSWSGKPYTGKGVIGYDNVLNEYVSTWVDDASTTLMVSKGSYNAKEKQLVMNSTHSCPLKGGMTQSMSKTTIVDSNKHVLEMFGEGPTGKMHKFMRIEFTRIK